MANIRARPYRSAAQPPGTINAPIVIENAVSAQDTVVPSASKVSAISPNATKLIEKFSAVSTMALPTTENSRHGEVGAVAAVSVIPAGYTTFGRAVETCDAVMPRSPYAALGWRADRSLRRSSQRWIGASAAQTNATRRAAMIASSHQ